MMYDFFTKVHDSKTVFKPRMVTRWVDLMGIPWKIQPKNYKWMAKMNSPNCFKDLSLLNCIVLIMS